MSQYSSNILLEHFVQQLAITKIGDPFSIRFYIIKIKKANVIASLSLVCKKQFIAER